MKCPQHPDTDLRRELHETAFCDNTPHWFRQLFGAKPKMRSFYGSCTVWYDLDRNHRAQFGQEMVLSGIWSTRKFKRKKP